MGAALKYSDSIRIERPIEEVFTCISNPEWVMEWNNNVLAFELLTSGTCGPGSQQRLILKHGNKKLEVIETTIEFIFFGKARPVDFTVTTLTREDGGTTLFKIIKETEIGGFARLLAQSARLFQRNPMRKQLKRLKARIEGTN